MKYFLSQRLSRLRDLTVLSVSALVAAAAPAPVPAPAQGGWLTQDPDSPAVRTAASTAVDYLGEQFGGQYLLEYLRSAQAQVVEGVEFRLDMRIAQSQDGTPGGARKDCDSVVVWSRPWLPAPDENQVTSYDCQTVEPASSVAV